MPGPTVWLRRVPVHICFRCTNDSLRGLASGCPSGSEALSFARFLPSGRSLRPRLLTRSAVPPKAARSRSLSRPVSAYSPRPLLKSASSPSSVFPRGAGCCRAACYCEVDAATGRRLVNIQLAGLALAQGNPIAQALYILVGVELVLAGRRFTGA